MALPLGVVLPMAASGGCSSECLIEIQTVSGRNFFLSEHRSLWNSVVTGAASVQYEDWIVGQPSFHLFASTQTDTASFSIQNLSGNTVQRDMALAYSRDELIGAFVYIRMWRADAEQSILTFMGNITEAEIDEQQLDITLEGFGNYSAIKAPAYTIDVSCPLVFASEQCGSIAPVPCQQSYGTCTSIERFMGIVIQWDYSDGIAPLVQIAQAPPAVLYNPTRAF